MLPVDGHSQLHFKVPGFDSGYHVYRDGTIHMTRTKRDNVITVRALKRGGMRYNFVASYARDVLGFKFDGGSNG